MANSFSETRKPIEDSFIDLMRQNSDIVSVVGKVVKLKPAGPGKYMGLCPFHDEKTPSFYVNATENLYHCFGCEAGGDTLRFIMENQGLDFYDALHYWAEIQGLKVEYKERANASYEEIQAEQKRREEAKHNATIAYDLLRMATDFYKDNLSKAPQIMEYLKERGIDEKTIEEYQLGYAPRGFSNLVRKIKDSKEIEVALMIGLIKARDSSSSRDSQDINEVQEQTQQDVSNNKLHNNNYDAFRDRIIFPILDNRSRPIGFGGRILDGTTGSSARPSIKEAKYLNSSDSDLFHKSRTMFGMPQALNKAKHKKVDAFVVVEGYMDVLALADIMPAVACLGTAFSNFHAMDLFAKRGKIILAFDGDESGVKAANRAIKQCIPIIGDDKELLIKFLPNSADPADLMKEAGESVEAKSKAWQAVAEITLEDYLLKPFREPLAADEKRRALMQLTETLGMMHNSPERLRVIQSEAERMLGGVKINLPAPAEDKVGLDGYSDYNQQASVAHGSSWHKSNKTGRKNKQDKVSTSTSSPSTINLQQRLVFCLLASGGKSPKLLNRWKAQLEYASKMRMKGGDAVFLLDLIEASSHGSAYLYGYLAGSGVSLSTELADLSMAFKDDSNARLQEEPDHYIQKILLDIYREEIKHSYENAELHKELLSRVHAIQSQMRLGS